MESRRVQIWSAADALCCVHHKYVVAQECEQFLPYASIRSHELLSTRTSKGAAYCANSNVKDTDKHHQQHEMVYHHVENPLIEVLNLGPSVFFLTSFFLETFLFCSAVVG
jgi:hypothetical protein